MAYWRVFVLDMRFVNDQYLIETFACLICTINHVALKEKAKWVMILLV